MKQVHASPLLILLFISSCCMQLLHMPLCTAKLLVHMHDLACLASASSQAVHVASRMLGVLSALTESCSMQIHILHRV